MKIVVFLLGAAASVSELPAAEPLKSVAAITPEQIGEFISINGTTEQFRAPAGRREPYAFQLRDNTGQSIRVFAWPETMTRIKSWQDLRTTGATVFVTAEVVDHEGEFELQIQDWAEVEIKRRRNAISATSSSVLLTTDSFDGKTTGAH